jgi:hypothetical protein
MPLRDRQGNGLIYPAFTAATVFFFPRSDKQ